MNQIDDILKAAKKTSEHINQIRLPKENESITRYTQIVQSKNGPVLRETGVLMLNKKEVKIQKWQRRVMMYALLPTTAILGVVNGLNSTNRSGKLFNYGSSILSGLMFGYYSTEQQKIKNSEILVFPKV